MIEGVLIEPLKVLSDERGEVRHMLRSDAPFFTQFGEIYFSSVKPGFVKGWKKHIRQTQHIVVPDGNIKFVLYDDRNNSPTKGQIQEIELGVSNYKLLRLPPQIWYAFKALENRSARLANCTDLPHDPEECRQLDISDRSIPYAWD